MDVPLRLLLIADSEDDRELLLSVVRAGGYRPSHEWVQTRAELQTALHRHDWDLILAASSLPECSAPAALALLRERRLAVPLIAISPAANEEEIVAALRAGAADCVTLARLSRLLPAMERELLAARGQERAAPSQVQAAPRPLAEAALAELPIGVIVCDGEGRPTYVNASLRALLGGPDGITPEELSHSIEFLQPDGRVPIPNEESPLLRMLRGDEIRSEELTLRSREGAVRQLLASGEVLRHEEGQILGGVLALQDVTRYRQSESHSRQVQKMEAVGRLAGGVAHDFNNILAVILGYSALLLEQLGPDAPASNYLREIQAAGERGAVLSRQLLAFSRKQVLKLEVLDLNTVVTQVSQTLSRLLGEEITLCTDLDPQLPCL
ncbi:MAG TPA: histidine kinase dimerization/phospho-acceptor domain-containing protein, partial [Armatimonadota bacterium]|nr:histidine kinase dimerization/phospho-acceptor domain-containing protein [Armatimonadota bacterium]